MGWAPHQENLHSAFDLDEGHGPEGELSEGRRKKDASIAPAQKQQGTNALSATTQQAEEVSLWYSLNLWALP